MPSAMCTIDRSECFRELKTIVDIPVVRPAGGDLLPPSPASTATASAMPAVHGPGVVPRLITSRFGCAALLKRWRGHSPDRK